MCCRVSERFAAKTRWAREEIPMLFFRRFKSTYHARAWVDYERVLAARTILSMLSRIILSALFMLNQRENYHLTEDYLKTQKGPPNADLAQEIFPWFKTMNQIFLVARLVFFVACLKWPRLIKLSLYLEYFKYVLNFGLPQELNNNSETLLLVLNIQMDFVLCYFEFAPGLIASLLAIVLTYTKRAVFFEEAIGGLSIDCVISIIWVTMNLVIIHLIISKVGMIYTDAEVLRDGND